MELRHLRYFEAVARHGNVTRAARELHIAQPSLSKQIRALESELGVQLFDRLGRRVELADAGRLLLPYARRILHDVDLAREALHQRADLTAGRVSLGAPPTVGTQLLPRVLAEWNARYGNIALELHEQGAGRLLALLADGTVDLAVVPSTSVNTTAIELLREELVIAVAEGEPLAQRGEVQAAELAGQAFILYPSGYDLRERTLQFCRDAGFEPRIVLDGGEMDTVLRLAAAGLGIALVPRLALAGASGLAAVRIRGAELVRTLYLLWSSQRELSPAAAALRDFLVDQIRHPDGNAKTQRTQGRKGK